ncbi:SDR family NAD(P)-dependent oxidoreductase, partial [Bacillus sp. SIMBA_161]
MTKQTVIVTGGSRGMGKAMATHVASGGWNVVITGRTEETLEKSASDIKQEGGSVAYLQMDVRKQEDADQMVKFAVDT